MALMENNIQALEEKVIELESTLYYQEETIETLNKMVGLQQQEIMGLRHQIKILSDFLKNMKNEMDSGIKLPSEEVPPPHY